MNSITLSMPKDVYELVKKHSEIKWTDIARAAIIKEAKKLELIDRIGAKSRLKIKDILDINEKIKRRLFERYAA